MSVANVQDTSSQQTELIDVDMNAIQLPVSELLTLYNLTSSMEITSNVTNSFQLLGLVFVL